MINIDLANMREVLRFPLNISNVIWLALKTNPVFAYLTSFYLSLQNHTQTLSFP